MRERLRSPAVAILAVVVLLAGGFLAYDEASRWGEPDRATVTVVEGTETADAGGTAATPTETDDGDGTVSVHDEDGTTLGAVEVEVASTYRERYTGLSNTESLGPNEGMLFAHDEEGEYAYVMRDMAFPIDIVFVGANRTITAIHHAETEERPYTRYRGRGKYVLEVPYEWTVEHGVSVGDRVRIEWADGTETPTREDTATQDATDEGGS